MELPEERPVWADKLVEWARLDNVAEELLDYFRGLWCSLYRTRELFVAQGFRFKKYIAESLPADLQDLYYARGVYSKLNNNTAMKQKKANVTRKVNRLFDKLTNEIYGYAIDIDGTTEDKKKKKQEKNLLTDFEKVADKCSVCCINPENVDGCGNNHLLCHICFSQIVFRNNGIFKCPTCRKEEEVVQPDTFKEVIKEIVSREEEDEDEYDAPEYVPEYVPTTETREQRRLRRERMRDETELADTSNLIAVSSEVIQSPAPRRSLGKYGATGIRSSNDITSGPDLYETGENTTLAAMAYLNHYCPEIDYVFEPCSGKGAITRVLRDKGGYQVLARDYYYMVSY